MAEAVVNSQKATLHMTVSPVSDLNETSSPVVFIHGIPWRVEISKDDDKNSLAVYLNCTNEDKLSDWEAVAYATIKIISFNAMKSGHVSYITPCVFNKLHTGYGETAVIKWDDLLNDENEYVKHDTIKLEIEITANNPNDEDKSILKIESIDKCCDHTSLTIFRLSVKNVGKLAAVRSPKKFNVRGVHCEILVYRSQKSTLGVLLETYDPNPAVDFLCKMKMSVKLMSSFKTVISVANFVEKQVDNCNTIDIENLISWDEMVTPEKGFVNNDSITMEVEIKADKPESEVPNVDSCFGGERRRFDCSLCLESMDNKTISATKCGHMFCTECITKAVAVRLVCPLCTAPVQLNELRQLY